MRGLGQSGALGGKGTGAILCGPFPRLDDPGRWGVTRVALGNRPGGEKRSGRGWWVPVVGSVDSFKNNTTC